MVPLPGGQPTENPVSAVRFLDEQNIQALVLTAAEFQRMLKVSPEYLGPVSSCAYHTSMPNAEILGLTWDWVDLAAGFIQLREVDTKMSGLRNIPIGREL
jgi:hypothetical protein